MTEEYSIVFMYHIFFFYSSVDGHLACFHVLAICKYCCNEDGVHVSFQIIVISNCMLRSGTAGSCDSSSLSFLRDPHTVLHSNCSDLQYHHQCGRVAFSPYILQHLLLVDFAWMAILSRNMILHCSFDLHFCNSDAEHLFMCFLAICLYSLEKCLFKSSVHFLIGFFWGFCFFL